MVFLADISEANGFILPHVDVNPTQGKVEGHQTSTHSFVDCEGERTCSSLALLTTKPQAIRMISRALSITERVKPPYRGFTDYRIRIMHSCTVPCLAVVYAGFCECGFLRENGDCYGHELPDRETRVQVNLPQYRMI